MATIIITGGGTGGHVFPALAIAKELKKRGYSIEYVGGTKGLENTLVPKEGFPLHTLSTGAVKNQSFLKRLDTVYQILKGFFWSLKFLGKMKPIAVFGVGGYVCFPMSLASVFRRIPLFLHEQNATAGIANRILSPFTRRVFLGFEQAKKDFRLASCLYTGNPLRSEFFEKPFPPISKEKPFLLIMGGSQGAKAINEAMVKIIPQLKDKFEVLHQTGKNDCEPTQKAYAVAGFTNVTVVPFIEDVVSAYRKASLVICRAGALTLSELMVSHRPAILIPYPRKGQNDQIDNSYYLKSLGVAEVVEQGEKFLERLQLTLEQVAPHEKLLKMQQKYSQLQSSEALVSIADQLEKDLKVV